MIAAIQSLGVLPARPEAEAAKGALTRLVEPLERLARSNAYTYLEVLNLHALFVGVALDAEFEAERHTVRLRAVLRPEHAALAPAVLEAIADFRARFAGHSDSWSDALGALASRHATGQALSLLARDPNFRLVPLRRAAEKLASPRAGAMPWERLAAAQGVLALFGAIDLAFAGVPPEDARASAVLAAAWEADLVARILLDVARIADDLRDGLANPALLLLRETALAGRPTVLGFEPNVTPSDSIDLVARAAARLSPSLVEAARVWPEARPGLSTFPQRLADVLLADRPADAKAFLAALRT